MSGTITRVRPPWYSLIPLCLSLVPVTALVYQVCLNVVDVPFWDQWQFIPILVKFNDHNLDFSDLFQPHNGHRILFPRIIMLALATLSDWNLTYEVACILLLALSTLGALFYIAMLAFADIQRSSWLWLLPALAVLVFSFRQYQSWLWGWQISVFLNVAAACWAIALLGHGKESLTLFACSVVLAMVSSLSFATGLLLWIVALPLLFGHTRHRKLKVLCWIASATGVYTAYFYGLAQPPLDLPSVDLLAYLMKFAHFFLVMVGALVVTDREPDAMAAAVFLLLCLLLATGVIRWKYRNIRGLSLLWTLALYSVAGAALTTLGRLGHGTEYALQSRYTTLMVPVWSAALILLLYLGVKQFVGGGLRARLYSCIALSLFAAVTVSAATTSMQDVKSMRDVHRGLSTGRDALLRSPPHDQRELYRTICWDPDLVVHYSAWLRAHQLSLFRPHEANP